MRVEGGQGLGYRPEEQDGERGLEAAEKLGYRAGGGCWERPEKKTKRQANGKE